MEKYRYIINKIVILDIIHRLRLFKTRRLYFFVGPFITSQPQSLGEGCRCSRMSLDFRLSSINAYVTQPQYSTAKHKKINVLDEPSQHQPMLQSFRTSLNSVDRKMIMKLMNGEREEIKKEIVSICTRTTTENYHKHIYRVSEIVITPDSHFPDATYP